MVGNPYEGLTSLRQNQKQNKGVAANTSTPRGRHSSEFKVSMVCRVSSRTVKGYTEKARLKKKIKKKKLF